MLQKFKVSEPPIELKVFLQRIKAVIEQKIGKTTKKEIMEFCPDISKVTVERTLTGLLKDGYIQKVGAGPATAYVKTDTIF